MSEQLLLSNVVKSKTMIDMCFDIVLLSFSSQVLRVMNITESKTCPMQKESLK